MNEHQCARHTDLAVGVARIDLRTLGIANDLAEMRAELAEERKTREKTTRGVARLYGAGAAFLGLVALTSAVTRIIGIW